MSDHVFVEEKPMAGKEHPLQPGATIGREGCDINLADPEVSRRHAAIRVDASGPGIEDLGSTNGTFVNDQRIEGLRPLREGDAVRFGNTVWRLRAAAGATRIGDVPAAAAPAAAAEPTAVQPPTGPPQVTAAAQAPPAAPPQQAPPQAAPQQAPPAAPPQQAPAQPQQAPEAAPGPAQVAASVGAPDQRGDVPRPPDVAPSAIRRVLPAPSQGQAPAFNPSASTTVRGSAATRIGPTIFAFVVTALTSAGVILYLILYEP